MRFSEAYVKMLKGKTKTPSFMVSLKPNENTEKKLLALQKQIDFPKDAKESDLTEKGQLHITLRYWKEEDWDIKHLDELIYPLGEEDFFPKAVEIKEKPKWGVLGKDHALVLLLKDAPLVKEQGRIDKLLQDHGVPPSDFPVFKPHVSIGYLNSDELPKDLPEVDFPIEFNVLEFKNYKDKIYVKKTLK